MIEFQHVDEVAMTQLNVLADRARRVLIAAGLPIHDKGNQDGGGGVEIEVDSGDDEAGGVFAYWIVHRELADEVSSALLNGELDHTSIQYSGKICVAMRDAVISILGAAGVAASIAEDDMRPVALRISG